MMETLGNRMRARAREQGWTQKEISERTGINVNLVCLYIGDKVEPTASRIVWLCEALGVSADWMLGIGEEGYDK